jgi:hypothetical protein
MSEEDKRNFDKKLWKEWLLKYIERLYNDDIDENDLKSENNKRIALMNSNNPRFVLLFQNKNQNFKYFSITKIDLYFAITLLRVR